MRIDKFLSNLNYGTRTEIKKAMKKKMTLVNNVVITDPKFIIDPMKDKVTFNGIDVFYKDVITLMMNKPKGYICANKDGLHQTVFDLLGEPYNRFALNIAGRLDIDTEGLILLTNDGDYLHNIISPTKSVYKKYYVEVDLPFDSKKLLNEIEILDGRSSTYIPMTPRVEQISDTTFYLQIKEGKFHQVKRMCQHYGRKVVYLKRVAIGDIVLDETLELGEYKEL